MPRRKSTPATDMTQTVDVQALDQAAALVGENQQRLTMIDAEYGDGLPYDRQRIIYLCRDKTQELARHALELGRLLVLMKEHEPQGEFQAALGEIGIAPRAAQKMMQAAVKFTGKKVVLASLGQTKMLELLTEDDEELVALADGGTIAGQTLDDIDRMTASELRQKLREARRDKEAQEQLLQKKNEKIDQLDAELTQLDGKPKIPSWPELVSQSLAETSVAAGSILEACDKLEVLREQIQTANVGDTHAADEEAEPYIEAMAINYLDSVQAAWGKVGELMSDAEQLFQHFKDRAVSRELNAPESVEQ